MNISVRTLITENTDSQIGSKCTFINEMIGSKDDLYFDINWIGDRTYRVDNKPSLGLPINVFNAIPIDKSKCNFVHIYAFNTTEGVEQITHPVKFLLKAGGVVLGYMSQFELGNVEQIAYDVVIEDIQLNTDQQIDLVIVLGAKL